MPKAILEYNLPEESQEFEEAINGNKYKSILQELDNTLRSRLKHESHSEGYQEACEQIRQQIFDDLRDANLSLY